MKKARIWSDYQRMNFFGPVPSAHRVWHFSSSTHWAEADSFEGLMIFLRYTVFPQQWHST